MDKIYLLPDDEYLPRVCGGSFMGHRVVNSLRHLLSSFSAEVQPGEALPPFFSSPTVNKYPFQILFSALSFIILCILSISPRIMASSVSAVLCGVPKCQKAAACRVEKRRVR